MSDFKLIRRDVCSMCQTSKKELEALREVAEAAGKDHPDNCCGHCEICDALKNLDEVRRG